MKIFQLLLVLILTQSTCFAYTTPYMSPFMHQRMHRRGVITGVPAPIVQYNVPVMPQPYYINKKHIKKKYRKYYFPSSVNSVTNTGVTILDNN